MPVWAAILIALGSGLLGTLLTISHERGAEFRTRQLTSAEDFLRGAEKIRQALRRPLSADPDEALARIRDAREELVATVMWVGLLYGPRSEANTLAESAGGFMWNAEEAWEAFFKGDESAYEVASEELRNASYSLEAFAVVAARDVRSSRPMQVARRIQRRLSRKTREERWAALIRHSAMTSDDSATSDT